jgi:hypothetical protein
MVKLLRLKGDLSQSNKIVRNNFKQPIIIPPKSKIALAGVDLTVFPRVTASGTMTIDGQAIAVDVSKLEPEDLYEELERLINYKAGSIDADHGNEYAVRGAGGRLTLSKTEYDISDMRFDSEFDATVGNPVVDNLGNISGDAYTVVSEFDLPRSGFVMKGNVTDLGFTGTEACGFETLDADGAALVGVRIRDQPTVDTVSLNFGGTTGYVTATDVPTTGGTGVGCTVDITAVAGIVTVVAVNEPGFGYTAGDILTINQGGTASDDALFTVDTVLDVSKYSYVLNNVETETNLSVFADGTDYDSVKISYRPQTQRISVSITPDAGNGGATSTFYETISQATYDAYFGRDKPHRMTVFAGDNDLFQMADCQGTFQGHVLVPTELTLVFASTEAGIVFRESLGFVFPDYYARSDATATIIGEQGFYSASISIAIEPFMLESYDGARDANYQPNIVYVLHDPDYVGNTVRLDVPTLIPLDINNEKAVNLNQIRVQFYSDLGAEIEFARAPIVTLLILRENEQI